VIAHLVLFRPPASFDDAAAEALLSAMEHAFSNIDDIARVRIGRRQLVGRGYEAQMREHFEYAAVLEFASQEALLRYLDHPAHVDLGRRFFTSAEAALVYDFKMVEPFQARDLLR
jgi:hypothetical protein